MRRRSQAASPGAGSASSTRSTLSRSSARLACSNAPTRCRRLNATASAAGSTDYLTWMTTHAYGQAERDAKNNHGTCWVMQVAEFARYANRPDLTAFCRERFKTVIVPGQIAPDGSFPEELRRTKPYGYSLFNLDAMATVCQILSTSDDNLWRLRDARRPRRRAGAVVPCPLHRGQARVEVSSRRHVLR